MDTAELQSILSSLPLGEIRYAERLGSTNAAAMTWLGSAAGAPDLSLVVADEQTAGRGRFNRRWVTRPGAALAASLIVHPSADEMPHLRRFTALGAFAVADALQNLYGLAPQIKWPNDVLLDRRKVSGILVETAWSGDRLQGMVIGMGVNVRPDALPPADELQFPATSVEDALGRPADRWQILHAMHSALLAWRPKIGTPEFLDAWDARLAFRGEKVHITAASGPGVEGRLLHLAPDGSLVLADANGQAFSVDVGDVRLRPEGKG
jgi:BirA family transcriptional regulator, biotin operon repressor / biotin---[acetyl-CoA-carboxylase] ligase